MTNTIRARVDNELTRHVGRWFTVRQIQDKLRVNPSTLKPLIMKYARERVLRRRSVRGTARSVEFSPAAGSSVAFRQLLVRNMPYRNFSDSSRRSSGRQEVSSRSRSRRSSKRSRR